ncbi:MAG: hypothetical protein ACFFED_17590 [Candidatus Thorarchaeota archaeon]
MKILTGPKFNDEALRTFAETCIRKKGILKRESVEGFNIGNQFMRTFRYVEFFDANSCLISKSLIDEELASLLNDFEETILLWRPRYANLAHEDITLAHQQANRNNEDKEFLEGVIADFLGARKTAQDNLSELKDEIVNMQSSWRSTASLLLPRSPSALMKQEEVDKAKRYSDGIVRATSLVMNCSDSSSVESAVVGERVVVETTLIEFYSLENESRRIVALENPSAENINDAQSKGRALTRLLEINEICREKLSDSIFD